MEYPNITKNEIQTNIDSPYNTSWLVTSFYMIYVHTEPYIFGGENSLFILLESAFIKWDPVEYVFGMLATWWAKSRLIITILWALLVDLLC